MIRPRSARPLKSRVTGNIGGRATKDPANGGDMNGGGGVVKL